MRRILLALIVILIMAGTAQAFPNEPTGFQLWSLGMPFEEAEPWLEFVRRDVAFGCSVYEPVDSKFLGSRISLQLSFHRGRLVMICFSPDDLSLVDNWRAEFIKRFGEPTNKTVIDPPDLDFGSIFLNWEGEKAVVKFMADSSGKGDLRRYTSAFIFIYERDYYDLVDLHFLGVDGW